MNKIYRVGENNNTICIKEYEMELSDSVMAHLPCAFSPECALMKYIMIKQNALFWYIREPDSALYWKDRIKEDLDMIKKAKKLLKEYV